MKSIYVAPVLLNSGDAVRETLQSTNFVSPEPAAPLLYRAFSAGNIGFGL
jgi:hypothetical protein